MPGFSSAALLCKRHGCLSSSSGTQRLQQHARVAAQAQDSPLEELLRKGARVTSGAHLLWGQFVRPGDTVADLTCGNGLDTLWLAHAVGPSGTVYAVDLQPDAITRTAALIEEELLEDRRPSVQYVTGCHSKLLEHMQPGSARLLCFNLGYLPSADKSLITQTPSTLAAVTAALEACQPGGVVSVMGYTGHPGGLEEFNAVRELASGLSPSEWVASEMKLVNRSSAPVLLLLWKSPSAAVQV